MEKKLDVRLIKLEKLKEHEKVDKNHFKELLEEIVRDGILKKPIVADKKTKIILDGEHRLKVLKKLNFKKIPVIFVNYNSPEIEVRSWRGNKKFSKKEIIKAASAGKKFPPKTTKHMISLGNKFRHIPIIQRRIDILLEELR